MIIYGQIYYYYVYGYSHVREQSCGHNHVWAQTV